MNKVKTYISIPLMILSIVSCSNGDQEFDASGNFEATEIIVSSEATGRIMELNIEEGALVEKGLKLGYVDTIQLQLQKERLHATSAAIKSRKADIPKQIAAVDQQVSNLQIEKTRAERLIEVGAGNTKTLDDINAQIRTLQRQRTAQLSSLENGNMSADREDTAIEIQIRQLEDQLARCKIFSPINGTVLGKYAEAGEITAAGKPLFKVADMETIILRAYITTGQLTKLKIGDSVKVFADFGEKNQRSYDGTISWIADKAEFTPKTIQTKEERENLVYAIKVIVRNDGYLKIGMYGELQFAK